MYIVLDDTNIIPESASDTDMNNAIFDAIDSLTIMRSKLIVYSGKLKPGYTFFYKNRYDGRAGWVKSVEPHCEGCEALERAIGELEDTGDDLANDKRVLEQKITDALNIISKVTQSYNRYGLLTAEDEPAKEEAKEWADYMDDIERALS